MLIAAFASVLISLANTSAATTIRTASALPEPGVLLLLGTGLVGLATVIRRRFSA